MNKEKLTRVGLVTCDLRIDVPGLYQLSYLALHWRSPYYMSISFVRGRQSEFHWNHIQVNLAHWDHAQVYDTWPVLHCSRGCNEKKKIEKAGSGAGPVIWMLEHKYMYLNNYICTCAYSCHEIYNTDRGHSKYKQVWYHSSTCVYMFPIWWLKGLSMY